MVKFLVVFEMVDIKGLLPFFDLGIEWIFRKPTSRSFSVVFLLIIFPKWDYSSLVSSFIAFFGGVIGGIMCLDPLFPRSSGVSLP